jgi:hypothetical protein
MFTWDEIPKLLVSGLIQNLVWVIVGILLVQSTKNLLDWLRFGRWSIVVIDQGIEKVNREITVRKARDILNEPAEMSVFVKGVASPYGWIKCDLFQEGTERGLFKQDSKQRQLIVDLDKNPCGERQREGVENV